VSDTGREAAKKVFIIFEALHSVFFARRRPSEVGASTPVRAQGTRE
jgi:hypothetical protein